MGTHVGPDCREGGGACRLQLLADDAVLAAMQATLSHLRERHIPGEPMPEVMTPQSFAASGVLIGMMLAIARPGWCETIVSLHTGGDRTTEKRNSDMQAIVDATEQQVRATIGRDNARNN